MLGFLRGVAIHWNLTLINDTYITTLDSVPKYINPSSEASSSSRLASFPLSKLPLLTSANKTLRRRLRHDALVQLVVRLACAWVVGPADAPRQPREPKQVVAEQNRDAGSNNNPERKFRITKVRRALG